MAKPTFKKLPEAEQRMPPTELVAAVRAEDPSVPPARVEVEHDTQTAIRHFSHTYDRHGGQTIGQSDVQPSTSISGTLAPKRDAPSVNQHVDNTKRRPDGNTSERSDVLTALTVRLRQSTLDAVLASSEKRGVTLKQVLTHALRDAGIKVAAADLEDRTPRRKVRGG